MKNIKTDDPVIKGVANQSFRSQAIPIGDGPVETSSSQVTAIRNGEEITALVVTCACGKVTRIECEYE